MKTGITMFKAALRIMLYFKRHDLSPEFFAFGVTKLYSETTLFVYRQEIKQPLFA